MNESTTYVGQPIFKQLYSLIGLDLITKACKQHKSNYRSKKFCFKDHLTTMLYCVLTRCTSIREVQVGLELCIGKLNHLGLTKVPARSTLSDGNKKRDSSVFGTLYSSLYARYKHLI